VRLLSRYILRQLALPFVFGLCALTGVMLLNVVGRRFGQLIGKGLPLRVIGEVLLLSLPFILAMALPLAVLVATLYTFSQLTSDNEVTAMRAGGVSTIGLLRPVLAFALAMAVVTFLFVDQVLPRGNVRLRHLYFDIGRKKPTFSLTEEVVNQVPPSHFFLRASRIDPGSGRLRSVAIYDLGLADRRRIIYADSGVMGFDQEGRDLVLRLYDGAIQQLGSRDRASLEHTAFAVQEIRVGDVFDELERSENQLERGDREMSTCEMLGVVDSSRSDRRGARTRRDAMTRDDLRQLAGLGALPAPDVDAATAGRRPPLYCAVFGAIAHLKPGVTPDSGAAAQPARPRKPRGDTAAAPALTAGPDLAALAADTAGAAAPARPLSDYGAVVSEREREASARRRADKFLVEIHKKWALAAANIPFVLIAVAMALRFPRGGMGLVIGGAMFVYAVAYVGLTAGESLADRGFLPPAVAMWTSNAILTVLAILGLVAVHRQSGSTRGGDVGELLDWFRRLRRRPS
jgi:lipopolysaccharide export system permease protein